MKESSNFSDEVKPVSLKSNIIVQELDDELLIYDLQRNKAFCLNEISMMIWNLCDGENTVEDIRRRVGVRLKTSVPAEIVWLALDKLKSEKLLDNHREIAIDFNGLSRREMIRKVGVATLVALPLISTIVSPVAAAAQSQALVCPNSDCICEDLLCLMFGPTAPNQLPCGSGCRASGGNNCLCTGPFFCFGLNERFGACMTV